MNGHEALPWRTHRRHIHALLGEEPRDTDPYLGTMDSEDLAKRVVEDHNRHLPEPDFPFGPEPKRTLPTRRITAKEVWCPGTRRWMSQEEHAQNESQEGTPHPEKGHRYQY